MSDLILDGTRERKILGTIIETRRLKYEFSQVDLAEVAGITQSMLSRIELGDTKTSAFVLHNLCTILNLDIRRVFSRVYSAAERESRQPEAQNP